MAKGRLDPLLDPLPSFDAVSSERLRLLRFPLIIGVLFIHAYGTSVGLSREVVGVVNTSYLSDFFQNLISQGIARTAVPLFFLMSGYLFFHNLSWSVENYKRKIISRIKTLLVPFLFWNIFTLFIVALAQYFPITQAFFSGKNNPISTFGTYEYINAIFGIHRSPIAYQFWFIRDLIVMIILVPLIYIVANRASDIFFAIIFILWYFNAWPIYIPSIVAISFFYFGCYFAYYKVNIFELDKYYFSIISIYSIILLLDVFTKKYNFNLYIHNAGIILGIPSILFSTKTILRFHNIKNALMLASGCSFFVFATHEPLLTVVKKLLYKIVLPSSDVVCLLLYFLIPVIVITLSIFFYMIIKNIAPKFLFIISGGR